MLNDPAIAFMICFTVCFLARCAEGMWDRWLAWHTLEDVPEDPEEIDDPDGDEDEPCDAFVHVGPRTIPCRDVMDHDGPHSFVATFHSPVEK